ncbi:MAG: DUF1669 domain-containing protein [Planctomycetes bacterium]|nr:DUF1669 domain-containing protein [Planctomycetota bacterium]
MFQRLFWPSVCSALVVALLASRLESKEMPTSVKVHFSPTGKDRLIGKAIQEELRKARKDVMVAMYQFTYPALAQALAAAQNKAKVRVLLDAHQAKTSFSQEKTLRAAGLEVRRVDLPGEGVEAPKFHHKFCVIDGQTVLTGSYNWTVLADEENHENLLVIDDKDVAKTYADRFEKLWKDAK